MKTYIFAATYSIIIVTLSVLLWNLIIKKWPDIGFMKIPSRFLRCLTYLVMLGFSSLVFIAIPHSDAYFLRMTVAVLLNNFLILMFGGWLLQNKRSSFLAIMAIFLFGLTSLAAYNIKRHPLLPLEIAIMWSAFNVIVYAICLNALQKNYPRYKMQQGQKFFWWTFVGLTIAFFMILKLSYPQFHLNLPGIIFLTNIVFLLTPLIVGYLYIDYQIVRRASKYPVLRLKLEWQRFYRWIKGGWGTSPLLTKISPHPLPYEKITNRCLHYSFIQNKIIPLTQHPSFPEIDFLAIDDRELILGKVNSRQNLCSLTDLQKVYELRTKINADDCCLAAYAPLSRALSIFWDTQTTASKIDNASDHRFSWVVTVLVLFCIFGILFHSFNLSYFAHMSIPDDYSHNMFDILTYGTVDITVTLFCGMIFVRLGQALLAKTSWYSRWQAQHQLKFWQNRPRWKHLSEPKLARLIFRQLLAQFGDHQWHLINGQKFFDGKANFLLISETALIFIKFSQAPVDLPLVQELLAQQEKFQAQQTMLLPLSGITPEAQVFIQQHPGAFKVLTIQDLTGPLKLSDPPQLASAA
ncbi:MAG: hypothetical protein J6Y94_02735 [Bacteriovoracaceae bacterium]|nr:hypothetical protein [Bacteriovoracaceae bacterium]